MSIGNVNRLEQGARSRMHIQKVEPKRGRLAPHALDIVSQGPELQLRTEKVGRNPTRYGASQRLVAQGDILAHLRHEGCPDHGSDSHQGNSGDQHELQG